MINKKIKKLPRIMGGGGNLFFRCKLSPITSSGDKSVMSTTNNKYSAFSLIELSIVLIIMGLLVAGITGGASLIDTARISSLKREVDDLNRDLFTFYSRVDRFPGDFNNSGIIGFSVGQTCSASIFPAPYYHASNTINSTSCPFVELYLYEVSAFKPDTKVATDTATVGVVDSNVIITKAKSYSVVPLSKTYKDFAYAYRTMTDRGGIIVNMFLTEARNQLNKKTVDVAKKLEAKFDDGVLGTGNIHGYCAIHNASAGGASSYAADVCSELFFLFNVR
jgi:type II secretory pathway pseudopilin PulG